MDALPELPLTPSMRGEYLAGIKGLAKDRYLQLEIGSAEEFEEMWRDAFYLENGEAPNQRLKQVKRRKGRFPGSRRT